MDQDGGAILTGELGESARLLTNHGVQNAFELGFELWGREHPFAHSCAVHGTVLADGQVSKCCSNVGDGRAARLSELARELIGVYGLRATTHPHLGDGAFTTADAAGDANVLHGV